MERTITILGTIDNCKKAESLISAKLRASYDMYVCLLCYRLLKAMCDYYMHCVTLAMFEALLQSAISHVLVVGILLQLVVLFCSANCVLLVRSGF